MSGLQERNREKYLAGPNAATILQLSLRIPNYSFACGAQQQVCDVCADYSPLIEDYSESIRRDIEDERARLAERSERG